MSDIARLLQRDDTTVAVVGATDDPDSYGSVIYRDLKGKGFTVFAVNPNRDTVDGDPAYPSLAALPTKPTIVNIVVPPEQTRRVLGAAAELGLEAVWIQPGAADAEVYEALERGGFTYLADACIMVRSRNRLSAAG